MSKTKFTKGEWVVEDKLNKYLIVRDTGFGICETVLHEKTDKHNASLIAAAPEMYEMLTALREGFGFNHPVGIEIDELLAKARGEHE